MALININKFNRIEKSRNSIHNEVESTYSSFTGKSGKRIFQIDTYGSNDRQFQGKISQTIQVDKVTAQELIKIFKKEFSL
jgi:thymidylate kinase